MVRRQNGEKMDIQVLIRKLVSYGVQTGLVPEEDVIYTTNRLLELFELDELEDRDNVTMREDELEEVLKGMLDYAYEKGILKENSVVYRDLFDTKIMGLLMPRPSEVIRHFHELYEQVSPEAATDYYYKLSRDSDYIRRYRICKDMKWVAPTKYGDLDITINLSKPEKDPKAIAAAKLAKQSGYPKCLLCRENEGYAGRVNHPARQNHRIIPVTINGSQWGFQYSPYVYYNEHCIVFNSRHVPMKIERNTFIKLFDFVKLFPHYFLGSNADLPIVGGSILSHDHFQGGHYTFAMAKAPIEKRVTIPGYEDVEFEDGMPKGWVREKIGLHYNTCSGGTPSRTHEEYYADGTIPWVKTGEIKDNIIIHTDECITEDGVKGSSAKLLPQGAVVMAMYGVNIGMLAYLDSEMTCNQACCVFSDKNEIISRHYLFHYLYSIRDYLLLIGFGAAQQNLSQDLIKKVKIVIPPTELIKKFDEQKEPLYQTIRALMMQNDKLIKQRDMLLPRLMSGKLEV